MQYSIPIFLLLWIFLHPTVGQGPPNNDADSSSVDRRCVRLRRQNQPPVRLLPMSCNNLRFYDNDDAVFNGSRINLLLKVLDRINNRTESADNPECAESLQQYLCHYYFPLCNLTTGEIIPVCDNSCELLMENDNCNDLFTIASQELESSNISIPDTTCLRTHRMFNNRPPSVSDKCSEIEVPSSVISTNNGTINNETTNNDTDNGTINIEPNNTSQPADRCMKFRGPNQLRPLPMSCNNLNFYDSNDAVFNESRIANLQRVLDRIIFRTINAETVDNLECAETVQQYLCHYYFPRCNMTTGEIFPVCGSSCELLMENDDCNDLFMLASQELRRSSLPIPDELCLRTHRSFNIHPPPVSNICTEIEVPSFDDANTDSDATDGDSAGADTTDDDSNTNTTVIGVIVAIVAAVVIVIIHTILIIVLIVRRGRRKKLNSKKFISVEELKAEDYREERYISTQVSQRSDDDKTALGMKDNSSEINEILKYVEQNFSDVLLSKGVVTKLELIGKGAFGVVHKGELKNSDNTITAVAIKSIKSQSLDGMKDLVAESAIMKTFDHLNVLPLLGVCVDYDDEDVLKVVMPFMANGDLKTFLKNNRVAPSNTHEYSKALSENMLIRMCLDIAKGMEYVAHKRVVHRDLAARNCMVDEKLTIKVADFGLTRDIYTTEYYRADKHATLPVKWMSLESLLDGYFDEKTDMWSYGVTCWEIFSLGRIPYPGVDNADVITFLKHGKRLSKPELCPPVMFEMIETMWQEESNTRPTFAEIVETLQTNIRKASITSETEKCNYVDILAQ